MTLLVSRSPTGFLPGNLAVTEDFKHPEVCAIAARTTAEKLEGLMQALGEAIGGLPFGAAALPCL